MIRLTLIFCCCLLLSASLQAQVDQAKIDSLTAEMNQLPDSLQYDLAFQILEQYRKLRRMDSTKRKDALEASRQVRTLARKYRSLQALDSTLKTTAYLFRRVAMRARTDSTEAIGKERRVVAAALGYTLPTDYRQWSHLRRNSLHRKSYVFYDKSGTLPFDSLRNHDPGFAAYQNEKVVEGGSVPTGAWWVRVKLISEEDYWVEHTFFTGGDLERWDSVEVFFPDESGNYQSFQTGEVLPPEEWNIVDYSNHFRITMPPHSEVQLYIRVRGSSQTIPPDGIRLYHINFESFLRQRAKDRHANGIFQGIVLIQLFFFLLLFLITRDKIYGNYVIYILGVSLFIINVNYLSEMTNFNDTMRFSFYLISIWLALVGMLTFSFRYLDMDTYLPNWRGFVKWFLILLSVSLILFIGIILFQNSISLGPQNNSSLLVVVIGSLFFGFFAFAAMIVLPIWGISVLRKGYSPAKYYLIATFCLLLGFVLPMILSPFEDTLTNIGLGFLTYGSNVIEGSIALQLCLFALAVGHKRNLLEKERRDTLKNSLEIQQKINAATDRFVPYEFLRKMGRESIMDVVLGDQVEKNVTVFFSDIRDYTTLSEQMTPQQNFIFLNAYLGRVGPVIKTNRGFVGQYYGDGIMALFMGEDTGVKSPQDSVQAAIEMHREIQHYNADRNEKGRDPIRVGIGLHTGKLMLGVIGDEKRMDVGVVSDTVNTAARMEGLTKLYGASTLISESTFDGLHSPENYHYRYLGKVQVKGKQAPLRIYDFYDGDLAPVAEKKETTLSRFQAAMEAYLAQDFQEAVKLYEEVLSGFPQDLASKFYLERAREYIEFGVPAGWTGIETIRHK